VLQPDPCECRPLSIPIRGGCWVLVDKDCVVTLISTSNLSPSESLFIENHQQFSTPTYRPISCLSPRLRDEIQIIRSLLLFVGFSGKWSYCGGRQKVEGECAWISAISHHTWREGNGSPDNEWLYWNSTAIQMVVGLLKWDPNRPAQAIEWCKGSCWKNGWAVRTLNGK
jgi:hypothetical protein